MDNNNKINNDGDHTPSKSNVTGNLNPQPTTQPSKNNTNGGTKTPGELPHVTIPDTILGDDKGIELQSKEKVQFPLNKEIGKSKHQLFASNVRGEIEKSYLNNPGVERRRSKLLHDAYSGGGVAKQPEDHAAAAASLLEFAVGGAGGTDSTSAIGNNKNSLLEVMVASCPTDGSFPKSVVLPMPRNNKCLFETIGWFVGKTADQTRKAVISLFHDIGPDDSIGVSDGIGVDISLNDAMLAASSKAVDINAPPKSYYEYMHWMSLLGTWGGQLEIGGCSIIFKRTIRTGILTWSETEGPVLIQHSCEDPREDPVEASNQVPILLFKSGRHYEAAISLDFIRRHPEMITEEVRSRLLTMDDYIKKTLQNGHDIILTGDRTLALEGDSVQVEPPADDSASKSGGSSPKSSRKKQSYSHKRRTNDESSDEDDESSDEDDDSSDEEDDEGIEVVSVKKGDKKRKESSVAEDSDTDTDESMSTRRLRGKKARKVSKAQRNREKERKKEGYENWGMFNKPDSDDSEKEEPPPAKPNTRSQKKLAKSRRKEALGRGRSARAIQKRIVPLKVVNHGDHSKDNAYPAPRVSGLYIIRFREVLNMGKSINASNGLAGRIKEVHRSRVTTEVGKVTTITGGIKIDYNKLELFVLFLLRLRLPHDEEGNYDTDKILSTESFDLSNEQEGVDILANVEKVCKALDSKEDVFDDSFGNSTETKICFWKKNASRSVIHFEEHPDFKKWSRLRNGTTDEKTAQLSVQKSIIDPAIWDAAEQANDWFKMLDYNVQYKKKAKCFAYKSKWGVWLNKQRQAWKEGKLSDDKAKALEAAGVQKNIGDNGRAKSDEVLKKHLASLTEYQAENGDGTHPSLTAKKGLGNYIECTLLTKFYAGTLSEDVRRELYEDYGLEMFNPNKLEQIEEVNKLGSGEIKKQCRGYNIICTVSKSSTKLLTIGKMRKRLLKHIFSPEKFTLTKVIPARTIRGKKAQGCCGGPNGDECENTACCIWTSEKDSKKKLTCCMDCGFDWNGAIPIDVLGGDWEAAIMDNCSQGAANKKRARANLDRVAPCIELAKPKKKTTKKKATKKTAKKKTTTTKKKTTTRKKK